MNSLGDMLVRIFGDNTEFDKAIDKSEKKYVKFGKTMEKTGKTLTTFVTLPLLALGAAAVKMASDAEETSAKFGTAFRDVRKEADLTAKNLARNYGLSTQESERLLAGTGDLLKGFGATGSQALALSDKVQKLAVDLASYNNLQGGSSRASEILTKAMLGERDALVSLGTKVSEADIQVQRLARGTENLTGQAKLLSDAQITLDLVMQQSSDAMGDFSRTSDSVANRLKIMKAQAVDVATGFGQIMLPQVNKALGGIIDLLKGFNDLNQGTKTFILAMGGVALTVGPAILVIGKLSIAFNAMKVAAVGSALAVKALDIAMKTTIIGVAIGAVALLTVGIISLVKANKDQKKATEEAAEAQDEYNKTLAVGAKTVQSNFAETIKLEVERRRVAKATLTAAIAEKNLQLENAKGIENLIDRVDATKALRAEIEELQKRLENLDTVSNIEIEVETKVNRGDRILALTQEKNRLTELKKTYTDLETTKRAEVDKSIKKIEESLVSEAAGYEDNIASLRKKQDAYNATVEAAGFASDAAKVEASDEITALEDVISTQKTLISERSKAEQTYTADQKNRIAAQNDIVLGLAKIINEEKLATESGEDYNATQERRSLVIKSLEGLIDDGFRVEGQGIQFLLGEYGYLFDAYDEQIAKLEELEAEKQRNAEAGEMRAEQSAGNSQRTILQIKAEQAAKANQLAAALKTYQILNGIEVDLTETTETEAEKRERIWSKVGSTVQAWGGPVMSVIGSINGFIANSSEMTRRQIESTLSTSLKTIQDTLKAAREAELGSVLTGDKGQLDADLEMSKTKYDKLTEDEQKYQDFLKQQEDERFKSLDEAAQKEYKLKADAETAKEKRIADGLKAEEALREASAQKIAQAEETARIATEKAQKKAAHDKSIEDRKIAEGNRNQAMIDIAINTAVAISKLLATPWLAFAAGIAGAAQVAVVASKPLPPIIPMAKGGIVMPSPGGTLIQAAEAGRPEVVMDLDRLGQMLAQRPNLPNTPTVNDEPLTIRLIQQTNDRVLFDKLYTATRNKQLLISVDSVV